MHRVVTPSSNRVAQNNKKPQKAVMSNTDTERQQGQTATRKLLRATTNKPLKTISGCGAAGSALGSGPRQKVRKSAIFYAESSHR